MSASAYTTRRFTFSAGHHYRVDAWSPAENERAFGRLTVSHGHNYAVDVTVRGPIDPATGMVIDLTELKQIVGETVIDRFDHADLNADSAFRGRVPTTENVCVAIYEALNLFSAARLEQIRMEETMMNSFAYAGGRELRE